MVLSTSDDYKSYFSSKGDNTTTVLILSWFQDLRSIYKKL